MSIDWLTFKSKLSHEDNIAVAYIDEEGTEIPIDCESEFQEALRLAKLNEKNHLHLILTVDKSDSDDFVKVNEPKIEKMNTIPSVKSFEKKKLKSASLNPKVKESNCHCRSGIPPEWFTHYMRKFRKELLHELKSSINESVNNALKKEKKILEIKSEINDLPCEDNIFSPINKQKKKKKSDKDLGYSLLDQRDPKLLKKNFSLHPSKVGRLDSKLEKLEIKTKIEDKLDLFEKKRKEKVLEKALDTANKKGQISKKSSYIIVDDVTYVRPKSQFVLATFVENNGSVPWTAPRLIINASNGILIDNPVISLRKLQPRRRCFVGLDLRSTEKTGLFKLVCMVVDGLEVLGQPVAACVEVESPEPPISKTEQKELIDFDQDVISKSQKKIEENISEIEKRLQDIDLLRSNSFSDKSEILDNAGLDSTSKKKEKIPEGVFISNKHFCNSQETYLVNTRDNIPGSSKNQEQAFESDRNSDSEVSLVCGSDLEEDDNFIVVPSLTTEERFSMKERQVGVENQTTLTKKSNSTSEKTTSTTPSIVIVDDLIQLKNPEVEVKREKIEEKVITEENFLNQPSSSRSRRSFDEDYTSEFKSKKMKSNKSSEYQFTAENLTQPTFSKYPEGKNGDRGNFTFTFTGESTKKGCCKSKEIPTNDSSGKVIYAVNVNGCCLPVDSILQEEENTNTPNNKENGNTVNESERTNTNQYSRSHNEHENEIPSANKVPNPFVVGASSMANIALRTAKSVINNLQSTLVRERKTELGKPADEQKTPDQVSMADLFKLFEMGFKDFQTNKQLLQEFPNELNRVVEELVKLQNTIQQEQ